MKALAHRLLMKRGRKSMAIFLRTLCAEDSEILDCVDMEAVLDRNEVHLAKFPLLFFFTFKASHFMLEFALPPIALKWRPFSMMPLDARLAYLERSWEQSPIPIKRSLFLVLRVGALSGLLQDRALLEKVGYGETLAHRSDPQGACPKPLSSTMEASS